MRRQFAVLLLAAAVVAGACTTWPIEGYERLTDIEDVQELASEFNAGEGSPRLILLLSPTGPICRAGASWVQENILEENPQADLKVIAVWFDVLAGDRRERWDPRLMTDPRVVHYWDDDQEIGWWFQDHKEEVGFSFFSGSVVWDSYLLFDAEATWTEIPQPLESFGFTVLADKDELAQALDQIFEASG